MFEVNPENIWAGHIAFSLVNFFYFFLRLQSFDIQYIRACWEIFC